MLRRLVLKGIYKSIFGLILISIIACQPEDVGPQTDDSSGSISDFTNGVFVINEGNYTWGNGSLSFYHPEEKKAYNQLFDGINDYPLGDVPQSIRKGKFDYCICVNNSNSVIFCDYQMNVIKEFTGINSPRFSTEDEAGNVYVSSLYGKQIIRINSDRTTIDTLAQFDEWTENILWHDESLYIVQKRFGESDSLYKNKLFKLNSAWEKEDSVSIGEDISGMELISPNQLAVLSQTAEASKIWFVNLKDLTTEVKTIPGKASFLTFSASMQKLYYFKNGIYSYDVLTKEEKLIKEITGKNIYNFSVDALRSEFYLCDAKDFISRGHLLRYDVEGELLDSVLLSIIPSEIYFEHTL